MENHCLLVEGKYFLDLSRETIMLNIENVNFENTKIMRLRLKKIPLRMIALATGP